MQTPSRKCIAVLTRGYEDQSKYQDLIERNESIRKNIQDQTISILIFHEGNITPSQQTHISNQTPELNLQFIDVKSTGKAFRKEKESIPFDPETAAFPIGYRHMCSFWIMDFWHFVSEYDFLLRIDEDCIIDFNIDQLFDKLQHTQKSVITGLWGNDCGFVTKGMNSFTINFISQKYHKPHYNIDIKSPPSGPCCIFALQLDHIRRNVPDIFPYLEALDQINGIYSQRWGDGPLWGEIIHYFLGGKHICEIDTNLRYYHKSHQAQIN